MATIQFKAKLKAAMHPEGAKGYDYVDVPTFTTKHCDMPSFHRHSKYRGYANSKLFPAMLARIRESAFGPAGLLRMDAIPSGVTVDASGFLAVVTISVE